MQSVFILNSEENGNIKKECATVRDILQCKSMSFEYNGAIIKANSIYSDVIINGIAMIKYVTDLNAINESSSNDQMIINYDIAEYSLRGLSHKFGLSLKKILENKDVCPQLKEQINSNFFTRQLALRVGITGGGNEAFFDKLKLRTNYESILSIINNICQEAVKTD